MLYAIQSALCGELPADPLERLGISRPNSINLKVVACTFTAYHYVRRAIAPNLTVLEIHQLFVDSFFRESLSIDLDCVTPHHLDLSWLYLESPEALSQLKAGCRP